MTETSPGNTQAPEVPVVGQEPKPLSRGKGQRAAVDFLTDDFGYPIAEKTLPIQPKWMDQTAAASYLTRIGVRISPKTLQKRRVVGGGPPFRKIMGRVVYEPGLLEAWAAEQVARSPLVTSTSEYDD